MEIGIAKGAGALRFLSIDKWWLPFRHLIRRFLTATNERSYP